MNRIRLTAYLLIAFIIPGLVSQGTFADIVFCLGENNHAALELPHENGHDPFRPIDRTTGFNAGTGGETDKSCVDIPVLVVSPEYDAPLVQRLADAGERVLYHPQPLAVTQPSETLHVRNDSQTRPLSAWKQASLSTTVLLI
jgi:hypothetical protein